MADHSEARAVACSEARRWQARAAIGPCLLETAGIVMAANRSSSIEPKRKGEWVTCA